MEQRERIALVEAMQRISDLDRCLVKNQTSLTEAVKPDAINNTRSVLDELKMLMVAAAIRYVSTDARPRNAKIKKLGKRRLKWRHHCASDIFRSTCGTFKITPDRTFKVAIWKLWEEATGNMLGEYGLKRQAKEHAQRIVDNADEVKA